VDRDSAPDEPPEGGIAVIVAVHEGADSSSEVIVEHHRFAVGCLGGTLPGAQIRRPFSGERSDVILSSRLCILAGPVTVYRPLVQIELDRSAATDHGSALYPTMWLTYLVPGSPNYLVTRSKASVNKKPRASFMGLSIGISADFHSANRPPA
jgi:hypothetical protein